MSGTNFQCPTCLKDKFTDRQSVIEHAIKAHSLVVQRCVTCDADFEDLDLHFFEVHEGKELNCVFCVKFFSTANTRHGHVKAAHTKKVALHEATGCPIDKNLKPPTGPALKKMMEDFGYPTNIPLDATSPHFFIGLNKRKWPIFAFHLINPYITSHSLIKGSPPTWFTNTTAPPHHDRSHVVPTTDLRHLSNPRHSSTTHANYVFSRTHFNQNVWSVVENQRHEWGKKWQLVAVMTTIIYKTGAVERIIEKMGCAVLLRRDGEEDRLACFVIPNDTDISCIWSFLTSIQNLRREFSMPEIFNRLTSFKELVDEPNTEEALDDKKRVVCFKCTSSLLVRGKWPSSTADTRNRHAATHNANQEKLKARSSVPAAIEDEKIDIKALKTENAALQSKIDYLQTKNDELQTKNDELQSEIEELENLNSDLRDQNEELQNEKAELQILIDYFW